MTASQLLIRTLDNGLRVVIEGRHTTPVAAVAIRVDVGSRHEDPERTGFAHLFEHLMFQGSQNVETGEHFAILQEIGGSLNAMTYQDQTVYISEVPVHALETVLWLEADRFGGLLGGLDQTRLDNQRDVVRNERSQVVDGRPYGDAYEILFRALFPDGHQYQHQPIGSMEQLAASSLEDVQNFFRKHYIPSNMVLSVVADTDPEETFDLVEKYFGWIPEGTLRGPRAAEPLEHGTGSEQTVYGEVPAPLVYLAWPTAAFDTKDADALELAAAVLSDDRVGRLDRALIRENHMATSVGASVQRQLGGNGIFTVRGRPADGVDPEAVKTALLAQVERLARDGVSAEELSIANKRLRMDFAFGNESYLSRAMEHAVGLATEDDPLAGAHRITAMESLTSSDVQQAVERWLVPDFATTLFYLPNLVEESAS